MTNETRLDILRKFETTTPTEIAKSFVTLVPPFAPDSDKFSDYQPSTGESYMVTAIVQSGPKYQGQSSEQQYFLKIFPHPDPKEKKPNDDSGWSGSQAAMLDLLEFVPVPHMAVKNRKTVLMMRRVPMQKRRMGLTNWHLINAKMERVETDLGDGKGMQWVNEVIMTWENILPDGSYGFSEPVLTCWKYRAPSV